MHEHYCPYYCEENVWHRCRSATQHDYAVVISNAAHTVALWQQRAASTPHEPVVWDYHVVVIEAAGERVWDPDSRLPAPVDLSTYLDATFGQPPVPPPWAPLFRIVAAEEYRQRLRSDRRHMRDDGGKYLHPPPAWPSIGRGSNLARFVDVTDTFCGEVLDLPGLRRRFLGEDA